MGIGDFAGSALATAGNIFMNERNNQQNRRQAAGQMAFQGQMSSTSHQREVKDLIKAGLNPILSANAGASTPSGASAEMQAPQIDLPSIQAVQNFQQMKKNQDAQISQGQQRLDIDKAATAATIATNTSQTELNKTKNLVEKGGILSKWLGDDASRLKDSAKKAYQNDEYKDRQKRQEFTNPQNTFINRQLNRP